MKKHFISASALLLSSTTAIAVPVVTENTISWPDDGWYQVQRADNYESVCEGGLSCVVPDGEYVVINHTSGERYLDISVSNEPNSDIVVSGNTISWPDNGWYQVQRVDDYVSVCEGGTSCVVPNGEYIVINLTTGERFEIVQVSAEYSIETINPENYEAVVAMVFDAYTGRSEYADRIFELPGLFSDTRAVNETIACDNDGTALVTMQNMDRFITFDNCLDGQYTFDGDISNTLDVTEKITAEEFRVSGSGSREELSGEAARLTGFWRLHNIDYMLSVDNSVYRVTNTQSTYWVRGINSSGIFSTSITGDVSIESEMHTIKATGEIYGQREIREILDNNGIGSFDPVRWQDVNFESGQLTISAEDGSAVVLDPATNDARTVSVTITTKDETTSLVKNWDVWKENLGYDVVGSFR
jgi:hypothetical protein